MIVECGIDIVEHARLEKILRSPTVCARLFHPTELRYTDLKKRAGIVALKEAVFKALDIPSKHWLDLEVSYTKSGKPALAIAPRHLPYPILSLDCSVSHASAMTIAMVTLLLDNTSDSQARYKKSRR